MLEKNKFYGKEREKTMEIEFDDFIGIFDNALSKEYCDFLINFFDQKQEAGKAVTARTHENVPTLKKDHAIFLFCQETDPLIIDSNHEALIPFYDTVQTCYAIYAEKYGAIASMADHKLNQEIKIQKTLPREGYHVWHCEADTMMTSRRFLLTMAYLNTVDEGGETEFLYQQKRVESIAGRLLICPTAFTHTHRGNPPLKISKYMINGWIQLNA